MAWLDDTLSPSGRTRRGGYRIGSGLLLVAIIGIAVAFGENWHLPIIPGLIGLMLYIALLLLTIRRLKDAGLSYNWLVFMIVTAKLGPTWQVTPGWGLQVTNLLPLIPVAIGWWARSADTADEVQMT